MKLTETNTDDLKGTGDDFHFFVPIESISKSEKDGQRLIQGIASTATRDLQGEIVVQKGIDFEYFLDKGYINDDHKDGPENKVGEPLECKMTDKGLWIKAMLYKGKERADHWWEHINSLERNKSKRKVGFSIQGKIVRRQGSTILKCWLQDVAITASPVNTNTWAEIVKSLNSQAWCGHPKDNECVGGCCACGPEPEEKALSTASGAMLVPQSLEGSAKEQTYKSVERLSYEEALHYVQAHKGYTPATAKALTDAIFATHGIL